MLTTMFSRQLPPGGLTLAAGVTLTVPAGTVVKAESEAGILVRGGSLVAEGSADSPIVFTSIHDGSAGGATDTNAPPAVGDWTGITVGDADDAVTNRAVPDFEVEDAVSIEDTDGIASINLEYARVKYATTAVAATTVGTVNIKDNRFVSNSIALNIVAGISIVDFRSTNAAIVRNIFTDNGTALTGDSVWVGAETQVEVVSGIFVTIGCHYFPEMNAGDNVFDGAPDGTPLFSEFDYDIVQLLLHVPGTTTSPNGWTDGIETGQQDVVTYHALPCLELPDYENSHIVIASPFDFNKN